MSEPFRSRDPGVMSSPKGCDPAEGSLGQLGRRGLAVDRHVDVNQAAAAGEEGVEVFRFVGVVGGVVAVEDDDVIVAPLLGAGPGVNLIDFDVVRQAQQR